MVIVHLDLEGLEDGTPDEHRHLARHQETLDAAVNSSDPNRQVDTPVGNRPVVPSKQEGLVGAGEEEGVGMYTFLDKGLHHIHQETVASHHGGGAAILQSHNASNCSRSQVAPASRHHSLALLSLGGRATRRSRAVEVAGTALPSGQVGRTVAAIGNCDPGPDWSTTATTG